MYESVAIVGAARTPIGSFLGELAELSAAQLGGAAIRSALADAHAESQVPGEVIMGCVLTAGQGQAPARQAGFHAGLANDVPATTVNKMCGSSMSAVMLSSSILRSGGGSMIIAGGMESMSNAPYLAPKARRGARMGHSTLIDHMFLDGLEDAYEQRLMGAFADECADRYQLSREAQDQFAMESLANALNAQNSNVLDREVSPIEVTRKGVTTTVSKDEQPRASRVDRIPHLKPAFSKSGTVTPANSSSISDGAAAILLARESDANAAGLAIRARIIAQATHAQDPSLFATAPVPAIEKVLRNAGWTVDSVDLWEVNEAFAVVPMLAMKQLSIPRAKLNVHGGACAIGHPIGASGARIIVSLLNALEQRDLRRGVASICIGGGEGTAIAIERL